MTTAQRIQRRLQMFQFDWTALDADRATSGTAVIAEPYLTLLRDFAMDLSDLREREDKLQGLGTSLLRKEDARFIRGQGSYIDDVKLPGMLFGALVRSPYAHARIKSIAKDKALACPGVVASQLTARSGTR